MSCATFSSNHVSALPLVVYLAFDCFLGQFHPYPHIVSSTPTCFFFFSWVCVKMAFYAALSNLLSPSDNHSHYPHAIHPSFSHICITHLTVIHPFSFPLSGLTALATSLVLARHGSTHHSTNGQSIYLRMCLPVRPISAW